MAFTANHVFRDFVTPGIPGSGDHNPDKAEIRALISKLEAAMAAGVLSGAIWVATKADLASHLSEALGKGAVVYEDGTAANNGIYKKTTSTGGTGTVDANWERIVTYLPGYQFVSAVNDGNSVPNAYSFDAEPIAPSDDGTTLVSMLVPSTNTSETVTVAFNGGSAVPVKTAAGNNPAIGALVANAPLLGVVLGGAFVLRSDLSISALQARIEAALYGSFDAYGTLANRSTHDAENYPFVYMVTDDASSDLLYYVKTGPTSGDWAGPYAVRGPQGPAGDPGEKGDQGGQGAQGGAGDKGWSAVTAIVTDGSRRVKQVTDWVGGQGAKPAIGDYVGPTGLVSDIANAVDIRGPEGPAGAGSGDMLASTYDTNADGKVDAADEADVANSVDWENVQNRPTISPIEPVAAALIFGG